MGFKGKALNINFFEVKSMKEQLENIRQQAQEELAKASSKQLA